MKSIITLKTGLAAQALLIVVATAAHAASSSVAPLVGTWTLVAADVLHADGTRTRDYGAAPKGLLEIDASGRYSLQIFSAARPRFAANDKQAGTDAENRSAVLGASTHYGTISLDPSHGTITFNIEAALFPNWERAVQTRQYQLNGNELSYRVPARPDGNTPISVWRRLN
jgi:hypothetical protein